MSINVEALRKRLGEISTKNQRSNILWKPSNGKQTIRIVPYKKNPENPFVELKFHYNLGGKTYLSPSTYGRPDPVVEFANKVKSTGDKDDYKLAMNLFPKLRIYTPVIVRGEEDQGVRFWGFGKQVYETLLGIIADDDYGDVSSLDKGNDITVTYKPKEETGKTFPETDILPRPKKTPVGGDSVIEAIKNQPDLTELFQEPTYEELEAALQKFLNPEEEDGDSTSVGTSVVESEDEHGQTPSSVVEQKTAPAKASDFDRLFS
jgi:hypothetical protein